MYKSHRYLYVALLAVIVVVGLLCFSQGRSEAGSIQEITQEEIPSFGAFPIDKVIVLGPGSNQPSGGEGALA